MWVADRIDAKLYAYTLSDGSRDQTKDFHSLGNIVTLRLGDGTKDPYNVLESNTRYYFELTVLDEIGNESDPPARSKVLAINSDPPAPLTTYSVAFMNASTTSYLSYVSDQREFNVNWIWPSRVIADSGKLIIRIRDSNDVNRSSDSDAPVI